MTATEPTLWDSQARRSDPDTSQRAALRERSSLLELVRETIVLLVDAGVVDGGATEHEVTAWLRSRGRQVEQNSVGRRITTLRMRGLVTDSGLRRRGAYRAEQIVWAPTEKEH